MANVTVSRGVLVGLGGALGAALLALVFLVGRETGRKAAASLPPSGPVRPSTPSNPGVLSVPTTVSTPTLAPSTSAETSTPTVPPSPAAAQDPQRAAVAAFFEALDHVTPGPFSGDPQAMAQEMVAGLGKGDSSGFDRLLAQAEEARRRLAALVPPPPCASFHRESLAQLDESLVVMRANKKAMEGGESEPISTLAARAQSLQARSEALQREEKALRQRYGIGIAR